LFSEDNLEDYLDMDFRDDEDEIEEAIEGMLENLNDQIEDIKIDIDDEEARVEFTVEDYEDTPLDYDEEDMPFEVEDMLEDLIRNSPSKRSTTISNGKIIVNAAAQVNAKNDGIFSPGIYFLEEEYNNPSNEFVEKLIAELNDTMPKVQIRIPEAKLRQFVLVWETDGTLSIYISGWSSDGFDNEEAVEVYPTPDEIFQ
jgi:hypothetical protein